MPCTSIRENGISSVKNTRPASDSDTPLIIEELGQDRFADLSGADNIGGRKNR